jgi:hypothetical protein
MSVWLPSCLLSRQQRKIQMSGCSCVLRDSHCPYFPVTLCLPTIVA